VLPQPSEDHYKSGITEGIKNDSPMESPVPEIFIRLVVVDNPEEPLDSVIEMMYTTGTDSLHSKTAYWYDNAENLLVRISYEPDSNQWKESKKYKYEYSASGKMKRETLYRWLDEEDEWDKRLEDTWEILFCRNQAAMTPLSKPGLKKIEVDIPGMTGKGSHQNFIIFMIRKIRPGLKVMANSSTTTGELQGWNRAGMKWSAYIPIPVMAGYIWT